MYPKKEEKSKWSLKIFIPRFFIILIIGLILFSMYPLGNFVHNYLCDNYGEPHNYNYLIPEKEPHNIVLYKLAKIAHSMCTTTYISDPEDEVGTWFLGLYVIILPIVFLLFIYILGRSCREEEDEKKKYVGI